MADKADKVSAKVVDFSNVKEGGGTFNKRRIPSGDYAAKIIKVQDAQSKGDGEFQYLFTIQPQKHSDRKFPYYCKLQENQLWKLRNILIAAGISVPKKRVKLDPSKAVGKLIGITVEDDEYEGKAQSSISSVFPVSELADGDLVDDDGDGAEEPDEDDEDIDDTEDVEEEDTEEEDEGDEFDAMDRAALKAHLKAADPSFQAKKSQSDDDLRELARTVSSSDDEDEDEDEEEEAPEPPKAKKKAKKKAAPAVDDDEMEELDISDL